MGAGLFAIRLSQSARFSRGLHQFRTIFADPSAVVFEQPGKFRSPIGFALAGALYGAAAGSLGTLACLHGIPLSPDGPISPDDRARIVLQVIIQNSISATFIFAGFGILMSRIWPRRHLLSAATAILFGVLAIQVANVGAGLLFGLFGGSVVNGLVLGSSIAAMAMIVAAMRWYIAVPMALAAAPLIGLLGSLINSGIRRIPRIE